MSVLVSLFCSRPQKKIPVIRVSTPERGVLD